MSKARARAPRAVWVVASGNPGKLDEIRAILGGLAIDLRTLASFGPVAMPEEGDDYAANALAKARAAAQATGRPALADDSGLEVDALDGRPGPRSARYGGEGLGDAGRVARLLEELAGRGPDAPRGARFVCVAALATPEGDVATARGECAGEILREPRGRAGFGYDPVFRAEGQRVSMAELPPAVKDRISHRGLAFRALRAQIEALAEGGGGRA